MIIVKTMSAGWLSNSYLVADGPGGRGVLVDSGGPPEPVLQAVAEHHLRIEHLLLTHHHQDHVAHNDLFIERFGCRTWGHPAERQFGMRVDHELVDGDALQVGGLRIVARHTPGHTQGMLALVVNDEAVFTGDTLFRGTVGGTRAPGHATFEDLQRSIMSVLMQLPPPTTVYPGHTDTTSIGQEWQDNAFIRLWRGLDAPRGTAVTALGQPATLLLRAPDYDGGTKCQVRFADGSVDVVPGSKVTGD